MRNFFLSLIFVSLFLYADYSLVEVSKPTNDVLRMGELLKVTPDGKYIFIFNGEELKKLEQMKVGYSVIIPDMEKYYASRIKTKGSQGAYYSYSEADSILHYIHTQYPDLVTDTFSLGKTWNNNDIYCVILTNQNSTYPKDQVLIDAMIHAREPIGANLTVEFVRSMVEQYSTNAEVKYLLDHREVYVIPVLNPDGYLYNEANYPNGGGMWRKNRRDNGGGTYGVDLNRNYEYMWGYDNSGSSPDPSSETYRGPSPASEPETQISESLGVANNFVNYLNIHSYSNLIIVPWGYVNEWPAGYDSVVYEQMAIRMRRTNGYEYGTAGQLLYVVNGPSVDWYWGDRGAYSFVIEVGEDFWQEEQIPTQLDEAIPILYYMAQSAGPILGLNSTSMNEINGDGDQYVDPNEDWSIHIFMENAGAHDTLSNGMVVLTTDDPWIDLSSPVHSVSNVAPFSQTEDSFSIHVQSGAPSGHNVMIFAKCYTEGEVSGIDTVRFTIGNPPVDTIFYDDFESGNSKWVWEGNWDIITSDYHSPSHSATDSPGGDYGNNESYGIETAIQIDLTNVTNPKLTFYHKYEIEENWDYGRVIIKHGTQSDVLQSYTGYQTSSWLADTFDLSPYIGDTITVRFQLDTDVYVTYDGWYIDDVVVSGFVPTNFAPSSPTPLSPVGGANTGARPTLVVSNATDPENDALTYGFVIYSDSLCTQVVTSKDGVPEGADSTSWQVESSLPVGTYYWRAYAYDGNDRGSLSTIGSFNVITGVVPNGKILTIDNVLGIIKPLSSRAAGFEVKVKDQLGRIVYTGRLGTGFYISKLSLPSGIYFVTVKGEGYRNKVKMLKVM